LANSIEIDTRIWKVRKVKGRLGKDICFGLGLRILCQEE
jgi:hypothetical protein